MTLKEYQKINSWWPKCLRLDEDQFGQVLERMLAQDREGTEAVLKNEGEESIRWVYFDIELLTFAFSTGERAACLMLQKLVTTTHSFAWKILRG